MSFQSSIRTLAAVLCGVVVGAAGFTATPASADGGMPTFIDCSGTAGTIKSLRPAGAGLLDVTGSLQPCATPTVDDHLGIGGFGAASPHLVGLAKYGAAPSYGFSIQVPLAAGTKYVCLLRTPYGAEDCYQVTVAQQPDGSAGVPVIGARTGTSGGALRARPTRPPDDGFCATCW